MLRTVRDVLRTGLMLTGVVVGTLVCGLSVIVLTLIRPRSRYADTFARLWGEVFLRLGFVRRHIEGVDNVDRSRSYVFVSNHLSNFDPPLHIAEVPVPIRFLAKKELFRVPVLGRAMLSIGMIRTDRQAHASAHRAINEQVALAIERGRSLIIYPEGTRSRDGELHGFKKGAFRIAIDNQLPVLPITIAGGDRAWKPGSKLAHGGHIRMVFHEPIETTGMTRDDIDALRNRVHALIGDTYQRIRDNLVP
jgi:1-acyl-sn-glycerol-3-phosphate acyltransferase